jgi:hypothetical protein
VAFTACSDDEVTPSKTVGTLDWQVEVPDLEVYGRYYALETTLNQQEGETYRLSSDADWLTLTYTELPADGILEFKAEANEEVKGRTAVIRLEAESNSALYAEVKVYQKGIADNAENDGDDTYSIGYSYDAFSEYESPNSLKEKVLDMDKLAQFDKEDGFQSVQQATLGRESFEITTASSLRELSYKLTKKMDKTTSILGLKKTVKRYTKNIQSDENSQYYYAYSRMSKLVSTQSFDAAALRYVIEHTEVDNLPFTSKFMTIYKKILESTGQARVDAIKSMLNTYGSHIVCEASLGGMLDYVVTFRRTESSHIESTVEDYCKKVFGKIKENIHTEMYASTIETNISNEASVNILGGNAEKRIQLSNAIHNLEKMDDLPETLLYEWYQSIKKSSSTKDLEQVEFKLMAISDLFVDEAISNLILKQIIELQSQSNNTFSDMDLGINNYEFNVNDSQFQFKNTSSSSTSLVKTVYVNRTPVLEVCEEYVPKLRTDSRVKVFYPIYNGLTRHAQGLFPGDGKGLRPAYLSFYEGEVYVDPIDSLGYNDTVSKIYYLHGNLYGKDYGAVYQTAFNAQVKDEMMTFKGYDKGYPIVKIGPGYWTRVDITQEMEFGFENDNGRYEISEEVVDNLLFADIYETNSYAFLSQNDEIYGPDQDEVYGKSKLWYLPLTVDREYLTNYLGNNLKALFKGQVSGFDAQFEGYFGAFDDNGDFWPDMMELRRYKGQRCYVPFKDNPASNTGEAFMLTPNYTWQKIPTSAYYNYYPVRLYRTAYFVHKSL